MIKIIDNFFTPILFKKIQNHITTKIYFRPRYFEKEHNRDTYYGSRFVLSHDKKLLNYFIKRSENKFKIKIKKIGADSGIDIRNLDKFKPHIDNAKMNILIMLKGPTAVTNGTVFYTDTQLDMHIGFRENRAIIFPSKKYHSSHACNVPNLKRYTATLFIKDYENKK